MDFHSKDCNIHLTINFENIPRNVDVNLQRGVSSDNCQKIEVNGQTRLSRWTCIQYCQKERKGD